MFAKVIVYGYFELKKKDLRYFTATNLISLKKGGIVIFTTSNFVELQKIKLINNKTRSMFFYSLNLQKSWLFSEKKLVEAISCKVQLNHI